MTFMPYFKPNDYLFETHKDKGTEKWEIYAWAVYDIMLKQSGATAVDVSIKDKYKYWDEMNGTRLFQPKQK
jgi:hypothetical protein